MYDCEKDDKQLIDSQLNPHECTMLNDFELYCIHAERAEIEKWSIHNTKSNYIEFSTK